MALCTLDVRTDLCGTEAFGLAHQVRDLPLEQAEGVRLRFAPTAEMDVTGVAVVVRLYSQLSASGKRLVLADAPLKMRRALDELGLAPMLLERERTNGFGLFTRTRAVA